MTLGTAVGSNVGAALSVAITTTAAAVGVGPDETAAARGLSDPCQLDSSRRPRPHDVCNVLEPCPIPKIETAFRTVGHNIRRYTPTTTRNTVKATKPPMSKPLPAIASRR